VQARRKNNNKKWIYSLRVYSRRRTMENLLRSMFTGTMTISAEKEKRKFFNVH
jgi:hypothetical protein